MKFFTRSLSLLTAVLVSLLIAGKADAQIDTSLFKDMKARSIGPAGMSGRVAAIDVVEKDPGIIYVGSATGGLWKSTNGGTDWEPLFDHQPNSSIGAIAIYQANPSIVWVGTGESNVRNSAGVGKGIYKSLDGGKTWMNLGLEKTEAVSKIILDPNDPEVAYVAALGTTWGENPERGVYKTTDGGKTWKKSLYVDEKTGAAELVMDPSNPNKLICSMWQHRRWPWFFKSGGPGSGLYLTIDAGAHWKKLGVKDGLPEGDLGKIGLAFATNKPNIVYALVEAKKSELLRSEDGGFNWKSVNKKPNVNPRPFYFGRIWVNPVNENMVYHAEFILKVSEDGGKNFESIQGPIHVDNHALWLHPDGDYMIAGNDGGLAISHDRGKNWRFVQNLPFSQFYHISVDNAIPYHVYGGLQDNGSWRGPGFSLRSRGIFNYDWQELGGGDGFDVKPDPDDPDKGYSMSQEGYVEYYDLKTGDMRFVRPTEGDVKDRYNWDSPIAIDPFDASTVYYGSQFLHKSTDKGKTWEVISPDLTTNDTTKQKQSESGGLTVDASGAENYTTIITISPSPLKMGVIWIGTDDGNIQLTKDGGKTWSKVSDELIESGKVPANTWIPRVRASKFDPAAAYVVLDDHRRANWTPYVFVTHDYGESWESLANKQIADFALCIEEDPVDKNLLYLGTESGLYISLDAGKNWMKYTHGIPTVPIFDMTIQQRENDLVIGTHGRGVYILDDVTPLREINNDIVKSKAHLFTINPAYKYIRSYIGNPPVSGNAIFRGRNKPYGAVFTYYLNLPDSIKNLEGTPKAKKTVIRIMDKDSSVIRSFKVEMKNGINRAVWDLRRKAFDYPGRKAKKDEDRPGTSVLPGNYIIKIEANGDTLIHGFKVKPDPRYNILESVEKANYDFSMEVGKLLEKVAKAYNQIEETEKAIKAVDEFSANLDSTKAKELKKKGNTLRKNLTALSNKIVPAKDRQGLFNNDDILASEIRGLNYFIESDFNPPEQNARVKFAKVKKNAEKVLDEFNNLFKTDVAGYQKAIDEAGFSVFKKFEPVSISE